MAIEFEYKYILHSPEELEHELVTMSMDRSTDLKSVDRIEQLYLSHTNRIRSKSRLYDANIPQVDCTPSYIFTAKHEIQNNIGVLEIETDVSVDDYKIALENNISVLTKDRYVLQEANSTHCWEIDVIQLPNGERLVVAEIELKVGCPPPEILHPLVARYLDFRVTHEDRHYYSNFGISQRYKKRVNKCRLINRNFVATIAAFISHLIPWRCFWNSSKQLGRKLISRITHLSR